MSQPRRGEIWWAETPDEKRRPYVVLTRNAAIPVMEKLLVAPVTRRVRSFPTEVTRTRRGSARTVCGIHGQRAGCS